MYRPAGAAARWPGSQALTDRGGRYSRDPLNVVDHSDEQVAVV